MKRILGGFGIIAGATYPFRSLGMFWRNPRLLGYTIIPIIINVVLGVIIYYALFTWFYGTIENIIDNVSNWFTDIIMNLPMWLSFLKVIVITINFLIRLIITIIVFIIVGFILTQFGVLLGAPWYGQLSEQLEKIRTGKVEIVEVSFIQDIWRAILFEVKKLILMAILGIPLASLNAFPGIGTMCSSIGGMIITTIIVCLDFFDSILERRRLRFRKKLTIVFISLPGSASFGLICLGLISIPLLNLLTIPICVASGTLFICDRVLPKIDN